MLKPRNSLGNVFAYLGGMKLRNTEFESVSATRVISVVSKCKHNIGFNLLGCKCRKYSKRVSATQNLAFWLPNTTLVRKICLHVFTDIPFVCIFHCSLGCVGTASFCKQQILCWKTSSRSPFWGSNATTKQVLLEFNIIPSYWVNFLYLNIVLPFNVSRILLGSFT